MTMTNSTGCPFEHIDNPKQEAEQIAEVTDLTVKLLDNRYTNQGKKILRGVHPKSHGCVKAIFEINSTIDERLKVGLFAHPGKKFDAFIRFSNAAALVKPDIDENGDHGSRGMAIKVLDVAGEVLLDDQGANSQDFLMINQPVFAFANTPDYLRLTKILHQNNDNPEQFFAPLKIKDPRISEQQKQAILDYIAAENLSQEDIRRILETFKIVQQIKASAISNPLYVQYFSAAPFLFGPRQVMKFSAKPSGESTVSELPENPADNYLQDALIEAMSNDKDVSFDFMVQIRSGGNDLGIENASSLWDESKYPFIKLAKIIIPAPQAEIDAVENLEHCENLIFTPWHSLVEHQPIGSINRLRKPVYQASASHRLDTINDDEVINDAQEEADLPIFIKLIVRFFKMIFG